jgi:hypothetical protein
MNEVHYLFIHHALGLEVAICQTLAVNIATKAHDSHSQKYNRSAI